jgi:DNA-binding IclR family transcriptional regulator
MDTLTKSKTAHPLMEKSRRGIQSIEIGSALLLELAKQVRPVQLKDLAKAAGLTPGKAHPYMVSFLKVGFVTQTEAGLYELGPFALQLGLTRLRRLDPVREASQVIEDLAQNTGQSVALAVWGNLGPTIVRLEEPIQPLHVKSTHRHGDVAREYRDRPAICGLHARENCRADARR